MKTLIPFTIAAALSVSSIANAQAFSKPSGYVTQELGVGFNLVGLTLQNSAVFTGQISSINGAQVTFSVDVSALLPVNKTYILDVSAGSGSSDDLVQEFVIVSGSTITLPAVIPGLSGGDTVSISVAPTLEDLFGTSLQSQATAGGSDIVWLPSVVGQYDRYYFKKPLFGAAVWTKLGSNNTEIAAPNTPAVFVDGMFVQIKSIPKTLTLTGVVKTTPTKLTVGTGFNPIGVIFPVGATLENSNLQSFLQSQATAGGSDIIWVAESAGVFSRYFYKTPLFGAKQWVKIDGNTETAFGTGATVNLSSGVFLQRKGAAAMITLSPPTSYSSL